MQTLCGVRWGGGETWASKLGTSYPPVQVLSAADPPPPNPGAVSSYNGGRSITSLAVCSLTSLAVRSRAL